MVTAMFGLGQDSNIKSFVLSEDSRCSLAIRKAFPMLSVPPSPLLRTGLLHLMACCWRKSINAAANPKALSQQFSVQVLIDSCAITEHTLR